MMSSTFPVHSISYCAGWAQVQSMSGSQSDPLFVVEGSASRDPSLVDLVSPGLSSLSSSSTIKTCTTVDELKSVWDFPGIEKIGSPSLSSTHVWKCCWCNSRFKGWNATKVMNHVSKIVGRNDIKVCTGRIPKETLLIFQAYRTRATVISSVKRQHSEAFVDSIAENQTSIAVLYADHRSRASRSSSNHVDLIGDGEGGGVEASNATRLTASIADYVFCKGLAFSAVEGEHFQQILRLARLVDKTYRPPTRKVLSNDLLNLSYDTRLKRYMENLINSADVYGLSLFGDGATVHGMPLMNILATGVNEPIAVLAIVDCKFLFVSFFIFLIHFLTPFFCCCCRVLVSFYLF
jgi:hypothetical protein